MRLFAELLDIFKSFTGEYFFAILIVAVLTKVLFFLLYKEYYKSILIGKALKKEIAALRKKHKNNTKAANDEISRLLMNNKYSMFGGYGLVIVDWTFAILFGNTIKHGLERLAIESIEELKAFGLLKLWQSPLDAIKEGFLEMSSAMAVSLILFVLALQVIHDVKMEETRVVDQEASDRIIWVLQIVLCVLMPLATTVFLLGCKIVNLVLYYFYSTRKVENVRLVPANKKLN